MLTHFHTEAPLLVIGYGNTLRQDDQAGPLVVEKIESYALPGVRTVVCAQLSPEHAEALALARAVVFVDAQAGPGREVSLRQVLPGDSSQVTTHAVEPQTLLALARDVYGQVPPGWLLTIPAERFEFGTEISPLTRQGIEVAVRKVVEMAGRSPREDQP
jgi:hydrogenase maturation protease